MTPHVTFWSPPIPCLLHHTFIFRQNLKPLLILALALYVTSLLSFLSFNEESFSVFNFFYKIEENRITVQSLTQLENLTID